MLKNTGSALSGRFDNDVYSFTSRLQNDIMLRTRTVKLGDSSKRICFMFFDGMVDSVTLNEALIKSCITKRNVPCNADIDYILNNVLFTGEITQSTSIDSMISSMENGDTAVIVEGSATGLTVDTKGWQTRSIEEPADERVLQGPREGFDESAIVNVALIRRKLQTSDLFVEQMCMGRRSNTKVFICYLNSLAKEEILNELKKRLNKIDIDGVLDSNYIAENIRDKKHALFKTTGSTERPDTVAARLLEGRIALVVDGTPVVLTLPYLFCENFQADEDYYINFQVAGVKRVLRYLCFILSITVPALFVAITTFHIQLLPTSLMLTVAEQRSGVPFSSVFECLLLVFIFDILKETGLRTPKGLGSALNIVGGLVIGEAAVEARIVSAPMLIAVSVSGIAGLMIPRLKIAVFYIRSALILASAVMGLFGMISVLIMFIFSLLDIESFGADYCFSLDNPSFSKLKDTFIRAPWPKMTERPPFAKNIIRLRNKDD